MNGDLDEEETTNLPIFNLQIPKHIQGVDAAILDPRKTYEDQNIWYEEANKLAALFVDNFVKFTDTKDGESLVAAGPQT